jgi:hypothetical protein
MAHQKKGGIHVYRSFMDAPGWYRLTGQLRQDIWAQRAEATGTPVVFYSTLIVHTTVVKKGSHVRLSTLAERLLLWLATSVT